MTHPTWEMYDRLVNEHTRMFWALEKIAEEEEQTFSTGGCQEIAKRALKDVTISQIHQVSE